MSRLNPNRALVVLSGGQDSTICLFWALSQGLEVDCITFNYNQRHSREIEAACKVASMAGVSARHIVAPIGPILQSTSPLVSPNSRLETYTDYKSMDEIIGDRVELTFVPMRNALFLTLAANWAVALGCGNIITGVCQQDNANYPDCRQEFISSQERTINEALGLTKLHQAEQLSIMTPLMNMSKAESVQLALVLPGCMHALAYSHTAYSGEYPPITQDHATVLRAQGFLEAGVADPLIVRAWQEGLMDLPGTPNYDELRPKLTGDFGKEVW